MSTAAVPLSVLELQQAAKALKSTLPSRLNGVTIATKDPWIFILLMNHSTCGRTARQKSQGRA